MDHRNYEDRPTCQSCRYWSEMIAQAVGGKPVEAYCLNRESMKNQTFTIGAETCSAYVHGPYGAVDQPGGDPYHQPLDQSLFNVSTQREE